MAGSWDGRVLVVGTGLIGTSLGRALRAAGASVHLHDADADQLALAASLGAGDPCAETGCVGFDVALVCVPPAVTGAVCVDLIRAESAAVVSHTASVQAYPQHEVEASRLPLGRFVGGHPLAGRETSGPAGAAADLFAGRPWALCPTAATDPSALAALREVVLAAGAEPVVLDAVTHDRLVAQVSHVPQLAASALAGALTDLPEGAVLAGTGFRDTTRVADSPASLWADVVAANATAVADALDRMLGPLERLRDLVRASATEAELRAAVAGLVESGHRGRGLLPGKHGRPARVWASVHVAVPDEAGALARLLADTAAAGVNVEDLRLDHAPGRPRGVVELAVGPSERDRLIAALSAGGWAAVGGPEAPL
jgi:prephenate dehydrogenase